MSLSVPGQQMRVLAVSWHFILPVCSLLRSCRIRVERIKTMEPFRSKLSPDVSLSHIYQHLCTIMGVCLHGGLSSTVCQPVDSGNTGQLLMYSSQPHVSESNVVCTQI